MSNRVSQMIEIQKEALSIFTKKNHDYGDSFATYGPVGVIVRMGDKIQRLQNISKKGIVMVNDESVRDTLLDLHNYCAMAMMLLDEDRSVSTTTLRGVAPLEPHCATHNQCQEQADASRGLKGAEPLGVNGVSPWGLKLSEPLEYELPSRGSEGARGLKGAEPLINEPGLGCIRWWAEEENVQEDEEEGGDEGEEVYDDQDGIEKDAEMQQ